MKAIDDLYLLSTCWEKPLPTCKELLVNTSGQSQQWIINKKKKTTRAASLTPCIMSGQSRMDNPEKLATQGTQDTGQR